MRTANEESDKDSTDKDMSLHLANAGNLSEG